MLYKGADLIRDVEWVVFDEVHYVNDLEVSNWDGALNRAVSKGFSAWRRMGGSHHYAARSCQHYFAVRDSTKYQRIRRLGRVGKTLLNAVYADLYR